MERPPGGPGSRLRGALRLGLVACLAFLGCSRPPSEDSLARVRAAGRLERHVRQRRVLTRRRRHARPVRDIHVRRIPHLIMRVQHGNLRAPPHTRRAHLVDAHPGEVLPVVERDLLRARRLQHLGHIMNHVVAHESLVLTRLAVDREHREPPLILPRLVERHRVAMVGEHLTERGATDRPAPRLRHLVLERAADPELGHGARPALASRAPLIAEAAQIVPLLPVQVAIARDVEPGRAASVHVLVLVPVEVSLSADPEVVVHEVVPQLPRTAPEPARPDIGRRAQQQPRAVERRGAEKDDAGLVVRHLIADGIHDAHPGRALPVLVVEHLGRDRVGLERETPCRDRGREGRGLRAEIGAIRTSQPAGIAVLTRVAPGKLFGRVGGAPGDDPTLPTERRLHLRRDLLLDAVEGHRGLELSVGEHVQPLARSRNPGVALHVIIPGREVRVADRPVSADPLLGVRR